MPVAAGAYKISKMAGSGPWLPSCCSRVTLEIRPYCSRGLPYYSIQLYYILQYSRKVFTYVFHANVNRARARGYGMYGTIPQIHNWPIC